MSVVIGSLEKPAHTTKSNTCYFKDIQETDIFMNWQEILIILVPILSLMSWTYSKLEKKFVKVEDDFKEVKQILHSLDMRLTRLEGRFDERGYWESRKTGTHDEK